MSNENEKKMGHEIFDNVKSGQFLKLRDGEEVIVGVEDWHYDEVRFKDDDNKKPALILHIDLEDGAKTKKEFTITAKYFADQVKEYMNNNDINLKKWLFKLKRDGAGMETKYTFTPLSIRKDKSTQATIEEMV